MVMSLEMQGRNSFDRYGCSLSQRARVRLCDVSGRWCAFGKRTFVNVDFRCVRVGGDTRFYFESEQGRRSYLVMPLNWSDGMCEVFFVICCWKYGVGGVMFEQLYGLLPWMSATSVRRAVYGLWYHRFVERVLVGGVRLWRLCQ